MTALGGIALAPLYMSDAHTRETLASHISLEGHPKGMQHVIGLEKDIARIDGDVEELKVAADLVNERSLERHEQAISAVSNLDTALQREMRDLDTINASRIESLDTILQREMRFIDDIQSAKRQAIEERLRAAEKHLEGRDGMRFNMPDYDRMIKPELTDLQHRMLAVESNRWTGTQQKEQENKMEALNRAQAERISALEAQLEKVIREQEARTHRVYDREEQ